MTSAKDTRGMSTRHVRQLRRAGVATVMAAAIAFSVTACGGDSDKDKPSGNSSTSAQGSGGSQGKGGGPTTDPNSEPAIATIKGDNGVNMVIHQAKRDNGGFVTINGEFSNTSGQDFSVPVVWNGQETAVAGTGNSLAAMTLVDSKGKKRYYVLRDTDNRPLTTTGYETDIPPGKGFSFFAQFPAPPASTTTVELEFPNFPNSPIEIS